jgi:hypothetical protein
MSVLAKKSKKTIMCVHSETIKLRMALPDYHYPNYLHQLSTVAVKKDMIICLKLREISYKNICVLLSFLHMSGSNETTQISTMHKFLVLEFASGHAP